MSADPDRVVLAGGLCFVGLALVAAVFAFGRDGCAAYAGEVPPLIRPMPRSVRDVRDSRPTYPGIPDNWRHAVPGDGPMCIDLPELGDDMPERESIEAQVAACSRRPGRHADVWGLLLLARTEEALGAPRGLLAATYCIEGAMRSDKPLRGDWRDGVARALGPMQLHGWAWTLCGLTDAGRDDIEASAACYWSRVEARLGECDGSLAAAEALVASGAAGCRPGGSAHWREWLRWGAR